MTDSPFGVPVEARVARHHRNRISVHFEYDRWAVRQIKTVDDAKFVGKDKTKIGRPYWHVPLDLQAGRQLREAFGDSLVLSDDLKAWGFKQVERESLLDELSSAEDAVLENAGDVLPETAEALRGYQRAGAKFIASSQGSLIADQPGLGKTVQVIAAIAERGLLEGGRAHLVIAPATSLRLTWEKELKKWQNCPVFVCDGSTAEAEGQVQGLREQLEWGSAWLVINPSKVRYKRVKNPNYDPDAPPWSPDSEKWVEGQLEEMVSGLFSVTWDTVTIDESHDAIRNRKTLTAQAILDLPVSDDGMRIAMTGTPLENKPIDIFPVLHWFDSGRFSSKWRFADRFLEITDNGFGKDIGGLREDARQDFFDTLTPYVLRRTKSEVATELPPKLWFDVDITWKNSPHEKQYRQFERDAWVKIEEGEEGEGLSAIGVLDELTRLKQFAMGWCRVEENPKGAEEPSVLTMDPERSEKVEFLVETVLKERGILDDGPGEKVVVFSQFSSVVDVVVEYLRELGLPVGKITGGTPQKQRPGIVNEFQTPDSEMRVIVLSTRAGGASIELDAADTVVFLDETWNASKQEQAEDRVHRANKNRQRPVTIYTLRMVESIETMDIQPTVEGKRRMAELILDIRRGLEGKHGDRERVVE